MVLKDFYTVLHHSGPERENSPTGAPVDMFKFRIELNPEHPVYEGHFPGNPVVPGVCQVQMISELISGIYGTDLRLFMADNIKFLTLMVPKKNRIIDADIRLKFNDKGDFSANATLQEGETVFIKFKGLFRKED